MSSEIWAAIAQELAAADAGVIPDTSGAVEPWLSYEAIAKLTRLSKKVIENKAAGLERHVLGPFIKLSHLEAKLRAEAETKAPAKPKTRRKRSPRGK